MGMNDLIYTLAPGGHRWEIDFDLTLTRWDGQEIYFPSRSTSFRSLITKTDIVHNLLRIMYYIDKWGFVYTTNPNTDED